MMMFFDIGNEISETKTNCHEGEIKKKKFLWEKIKVKTILSGQPCFEIVLQSNVMNFTFVEL